MEENIKKRARKSKLVPRDCMDSDDENIAVMQEEIEAALAQMKNKSILKKLSNLPLPASKPLQFSVKVEVEELNETRENSQPLNIKIDSVKSLSSAGPSTSKQSETLSYFRISDEILRREFERLSNETTSLADKLIELNMKNILGKKRKMTRTNYVDIMLQGILRRTWKNWRKIFPNIRETPLLYKCVTCFMAWWHLHDFREHVLKHKKNMKIEFLTICHESYLMAHDTTDNAYINNRDKKYLIESNCWRCGKGVESHMTSNLTKTVDYRCSGCMEKFYTCTLLYDHENTCALRKKLNTDNTFMNYACSQCSANRSSEEELLDHMVRRHSVRSDLPEDWALKICRLCDYAFHVQTLHDCPLKPPVASCKFCLQKFNSHTFVLIHLNVSQQNYQCKVCGVELRKQCMELEHLMQHTENYIALYKCMYCVDPIYFPTVTSINKHKFVSHSGQVENKSLGFFYSLVVIPKRLITKQYGFKEIENLDLESRKGPSEKNFDNASHGLMDFLGEPSASSSKHGKKKCANMKQKKVKETNSNIHKGKTKSPNIQENVVIDITDSPSPREYEVVDIDMLESPLEGGIIGASVPDNCPGTINIKTEPVDTYNCVENSENNAIGDIEESISVHTYIPEIMNDIPPTEVNQFDPYLVIKEEKLDNNMTADTEQGPEAMANIKIENVIRIKEEPIEQQDELATGENSNTISNSNNKTPITQIDNSKSSTKNSTKFKTNIGKLRANINDKLRTNLKKMKSKIDNDCNAKVDDHNNTNELVTQIKEEVESTDDYADVEVDTEELTYEIKEETLDELIEDDMIILDPNNSVSMNYEMDPTANASVKSDDVDLKADKPELVVYHSLRKKEYKCTKCSFKGHHYAYKMHLQSAGHHGPKRKLPCLHKGRAERTVRFTCTKCIVSYPSWYRYIMHFNKVHAYKPQVCPKCFRPFQNTQTLISHVQTHIKESFMNIYIIKAKDEDDSNQHVQQCKTCSEKVNPTNYFEHWESHLEIVDVTNNSHGKPWKGFTSAMEHKHELKKMLLLLQGINPSSDPDDVHFKKLRYCFKCRRKFERKNECKRHFIEHLLMDAYQERHIYGFLKCQICSADFYTSERYKRHMREHGSLPLYKCELCDKAFSDSSNFTKHKKVHNLSVLVCDICNKKFTGKAFLEKHMLMHQTNKPLVCQECNKVFYTESSYRKHISRGKAQFKCVACHISFSTLREKWDHMWEIHKERKFQADCPICKMSFRKHQDVRKHIRTEHKDVPYQYVPNRAVLTDVKRKKTTADANELVVVCMDGEQ